MIGIKGIAKKPIIDATANPENVMSGKVFYNNSGKRSGTLRSSDILTSKIYTFAQGTYETGTSKGNIYYTYSSSNDGNLPNGLCVEDSVSTESIRYVGDLCFNVNIEISKILYYTFGTNSSATKYVFPRSYSTNSYGSVSVLSSGTLLLNVGGKLLQIENSVITKIYRICGAYDENYKPVNNYTIDAGDCITFVCHNW